MKLCIISLVLFITSLALVSCSNFDLNNSKYAVHRYRIYFDEEIVGHITLEKQITKGVQRTTETLEMRTQFRGIESVKQRIVEIHEEDLNGHPLGFSREVSIPHAESYIVGKIFGNKLIVNETRGTNKTSFEKELPANFLLREGLRTKLMSIVKTKGKIHYTSWNYNDQHFENNQIHIEESPIPEAHWEAFRETTVDGRTQSHQYLLDENLYPQSSEFTFLGKVLHTELCKSRCLDNERTIFYPLDYQILPSPNRITTNALNGHIRYTIQMAENLSPALTNEQKIKKTDNRWVVDVCENCQYATNQNWNDDSLKIYLQPSTWLPSNNSKLSNKASIAMAGINNPSAIMQKLTSLTATRLRKNLQFAGYATALQAYESRSGDCTEYALLLAALGRAVGIPTRLAFGLVYSRERFHGKKDVFIPHAWVQAWIDNRWVSYDAALGQFDAGHIALSLSADGNQQDFFEIFEDFDKLKILSTAHVIKK